jgi:hypothetical protein
MWRLAEPADENSRVEMCLAYYREDPGPSSVPAEHMRATLAELRRNPSRGRAVVLDAGNQPVGYALLIPFLAAHSRCTSVNCLRLFRRFTRRVFAWAKLQRAHLLKL